MRTAEAWLEFCAAELEHAGVFFGHGTDNAHDEAAWMLLHVLGAPLDGSFQEWSIKLNRVQIEKLKGLLKRRVKERLPLAYLMGEARFCNLDFIVTTDVLIPRSPVAELVAEHFSPWLQLSNGGRVLDMCTGGGCIAIAIAKHMPSCTVDAVDISTTALKVASMNTLRHEVENRVRLIQSDLFSGLGDTRYDLIVSNPL
jgi:ribosomal protein L3 glutamine methyltransferase